MHFIVIGTIAPFAARFGLEAYKGEFAVLISIIIAYFLVRIISDPIENIRKSRVKAKYGTEKTSHRHRLDNTQLSTN